MEEDEKEIIYLALSNSIIMYKELLENKENSEEDKELINYIIKRHLELLDKYCNSICNDSNKPISRPSW